MYQPYVYWMLFLSSYAPLFLILAIRAFDCLTVATIMLVAFVLSIGFMALVLFDSRKVAVEEFIPVSLKSNASEVTGYIASYIIPFSLIDTTSWRDWIALGILFVVIGRIYVRSDLIYVNPTLNFAGFRTLELIDESGASRMLITRRRATAKPVYAHRISEGVILEQ